MLSDTFAGIAPEGAPGFIASEALGLVAATLLVRALYPDVRDVAADVVLPHDAGRGA
jgi:hypothetical protein